jgi:hypothetical protein
MDTDAGWVARELTGNPAQLFVNEGIKGVALVPAGGDGADATWVLVWGAGDPVRVNGLWVRTGACVLADRDEVRVAGHPPVFFSTETFPTVETFKAGANPDDKVYCPRCKKALEDGQSIVRCPACRVGYHYAEAREHNCWGYAPTCACGHATSMDAVFEWTPHEVWE